MAGSLTLGMGAETTEHEAEADDIVGVQRTKKLRATIRRLTNTVVKIGAQ